MRIRNPKIKRALMTGMACLSTVIAVLSFTLKLPQAFLDGQNSLSVLAAGLTAPDGARNLFAQRAPENMEAQSQLGQETAGSQPSQPKESSSSASPSSQASSSQASSSESASSSQPEEPSENSENPGGEVPYTGGPLEEGEAAYPINEVQIGPSGTQYENFSIKSTCQTQIDIGAELAKRPDVNIQKNGEPEVLIMHTHTCEAYLDIDTGQYPESFYPRTTDERYSVVAVGDAITQTLNNAGIGTLHDKTIHDNPSYNGSYYRSEQTVKDDLAEYPGIQVVLDIHRDALGNNETGKTKPTFVVDGKKAAQIMIIAGCDDDGTWEFPADGGDYVPGNDQAHEFLSLAIQYAPDPWFPADRSGNRRQHHRRGYLYRRTAGQRAGQRAESIARLGLKAGVFTAGAYDY